MSKTKQSNEFFSDVWFEGTCDDGCYKLVELLGWKVRDYYREVSLRLIAGRPRQVDQGRQCANSSRSGKGLGVFE